MKDGFIFRFFLHLFASLLRLVEFDTADCCQSALKIAIFGADGRLLLGMTLVPGQVQFQVEILFEMMTFGVGARW